MRNTALSQIWAVMRKVTDFDINAIATVTGRDATTVSKYLKSLIKYGFVELVKGRTNGYAGGDRYKVVRTDVSLPDLKGNETPESANDRMWRSMRIFGLFKIRDIAMTASVSYDTASKFVTRLQAVGYVRMNTCNRSGSRGSFASYHLLKNTGVRCPVLMGDGRVFDTNLNEYFEVKNEQQTVQ